MRITRGSRPSSGAVARRPITRSCLKEEEARHISAQKKEEITTNPSRKRRKRSVHEAAQEEETPITIVSRDGSIANFFRRYDRDEEKRLAKLNIVRTRDGSECYFDGTQKEYTEMEDALENLRHNQPAAPGQDEVDRSLCQEYFQLVKERFAEMADYVLVEHTGLAFILGVAPLIHVNFRIKHKDENDSTAVVYFAELNSATKEKVTCFSKLNIDDDPTAFRRCFYCNHAGELDFVSGGENVYHPPEGGFNGAMDECV